MGEDTSWDTEKGELLILGQRHVAVDAQTLCDFLDSLVGHQVAEVIMNSLEFRLGKLDAQKLKDEKPEATIEQLIEHFVKLDRLSGIGRSNVIMSENPNSSIQIEVTNPSVKGHIGAAKSFIFSWWAGSLSSLLDRELDVNGVVYNSARNLIRCQIVPRGNSP